jgi:hypothetical protein
MNFCANSQGLPSRSSQRSGERRLVVPAGNAPASSGYQPEALLLSYRTAVNCGFKPNRFAGRKAMTSFSIGRIRMARFGL